MKNKFIIPFALLLASAATFSGCKKDMSDNSPMAYEGERKAFVQWFNGTVNSARNYIYVNGVPQNGAPIAHGTVFPASAFAFTLYSGTNGITIKDTAAVTTQVAQNFVFNFEQGKSYSIFTYDTITTPKRLIVDNSATLFAPQDNLARVRFLNLIYNPTTPPNVDLFSVNQGKLLATNIPVTGLTEYFTVQPNTSDTWQVRQTGTTTVMASVSISTTTLTAKRFYTAVYRGSHRAAANRALVVIATQ